MDLDELKAFIAVAEAGSFSAAAKSLNFAREVLARQVEDLETRSGVKLLKSAADRVSVTRAGESLAQKGRILMNETRLILEAVRNLEQQDDLITVEIPFGIPPVIEETALSTFRKVAPSVRWRIRYTNGTLSEDSDCTFALHFGEKPPATDAWRTNPIAKVRVGLFASKSYLEKNGTPETWQQLSGHQLLVWDRHDRDPTVLPLKQPEAEPAIVRPALVSPSPYLLRQYALSGHGIALSPSSKIAAFLDPAEPVVPILKDVVGDEVRVWISTAAEGDRGAVHVLATAIARFVGAALKSMD